jgi:hypothetical protein
VSIVDFVPRFFSPEREVRPTVRYVGQGDPPAPPPRPAPAVIPQTHEQAEAALRALQAASQTVRAKMDDNPHMARGEECFTDGQSKRIRNRWAEDMATALRQAAAGEPLSILQCGDLWRAHCCLDGPDYDTPGAIVAQGQIVADLKNRAVRERFDREYAPRLDKLRRDFIETVVLRGGAKYKAYQALAEEAREKCPGITVSQYPEIPRVSDMLNAIMRQTRNVQSVDEALKV